MISHRSSIVAQLLSARPRHARRVGAMLCAGAASLAAVGCTQSVSTSGFTGEQRAVAQTIADLQADVTGVNEHKICADALARAVVARLNASSAKCEGAIKSQLEQIDSLEVKVLSVRVRNSGTQPTASATVDSTYSGKTRAGTVSLVREAGKWKIIGVR